VSQIVRIFDAKGWTEQDYDKLIAEMDLGGHAAPGVLLHVAGPIDGGFRAIDVYESVEVADRLAGELIGPLCAQLGLAVPDIAQFDVHAILTPAS